MSTTPVPHPIPLDFDPPFPCWLWSDTEKRWLYLTAAPVRYDGPSHRYTYWAEAIPPGPPQPEIARLKAQLDAAEQHIKIEGTHTLDGLPARQACNQHGAKHQTDSEALERATEQVYADERFTLYRVPSRS